MQRLIVISAFLLSILGCGGSSGSNPLEGSWSGKLTLISDDPVGCSSNKSIDPIYTVSVSGNVVTVTQLKGPELSGEKTSDTSFQARFVSGSGLSPSSFILNFEDVVDDTAQATYLDSQGSFVPDVGYNGCSKNFSGIVTR